MEIAEAEFAEYVPELSERDVAAIDASADAFEKQHRSPYLIVFEIVRDNGARDIVTKRRSEAMSDEVEKRFALGALMALGLIPSLAENHAAHTLSLDEIRQRLRSALES